MKATFRITLFLALAILVTSCRDDNYDIQWSPVELILLVSDRSGNDLVRPNMENVTMVYRDSLYQLSQGIEESVITESGYSIQDGLHLYACQLKDKNGNSHKYCICFGEFSNTSEIDDDMVLTWTDGSTDVIHLKTRHRGGPWPKRIETWMLNGKECEAPILIVK